MSLSLYDAIVPSNLQILRAVDAWLDKAEAFCIEQELSESGLINTRLAPDMRPLGFQVQSCAVHSIGSIEGVRAAHFSPDTSSWPTHFIGLRNIIQRSIAGLTVIDRDELEAPADHDTQFSTGEIRFLFTGENFLLSFSQPNISFHATTAYGTLRAQGTKLSKRDFFGMLRIKR